MEKSEMMTVGEMIKALKRYDENTEIEIRVHNPSVGPCRGTRVKGVGMGIDWDYIVCGKKEDV